MTLVHCDNFGPFRHLNHLLPMRRLEGIRTFMCIDIKAAQKGGRMRWQETVKGGEQTVVLIQP